MGELHLFNIESFMTLWRSYCFLLFTVCEVQSASMSVFPCSIEHWWSVLTMQNEKNPGISNWNKLNCFCVLFSFLCPFSELQAWHLLCFQHLLTWKPRFVLRTWASYPHPVLHSAAPAGMLPYVSGAGHAVTKWAASHACLSVVIAL